MSRDSLRLRVRGEAGQIVVGIRLREGEGVLVRDPVAVPADVPPFHQHAARSRSPRRSRCTARVRRRRAVLGPRRPGHRVDVHAPPDADVLHAAGSSRCSPSAFGGLRFRPSSDGADPSTRSASWIVRHGVTNGVLPRTFTPSAQRRERRAQRAALHARARRGTSARSPRGSPRGSP